jgi:hypothetical protein
VPLVEEKEAVVLTWRSFAYEEIVEVEVKVNSGRECRGSRTEMKARF